MPVATLYRSLLLAVVTAAAGLSVACNSVTDTRTANQQMSDRWKATRLAVTIQVAQQQYEVGDFDNCRQRLAEGFAIDPADSRLHLLAAKISIEKGALEDAANHLKLALQAKGDDSETLYLLGVVYQRWQAFDKAVEYYEQAWDHKATEVRYMLAVVEMKIALGQLDDAQKILEDKMAYFEQTAAVRIALARIASLRGDYAAACRHYRDAIVLVPDDRNLKRSYAEALYCAGKYADAVPILEDLRQPHEPDPAGPAAASGNAAPEETTAVVLMLGDTYLRLHRPFDARACYQEITRDHPDNLQAVLGLGKVSVETGELTVALAAARKVLQTQPQNLEALVLTAAVEQRQKRWDAALSTLEKAAQLAPKNSTVVCMQGVSAQQLGHRDDAVTYFERAVALNPTDPWAMQLLDRAKPAAPAPAPAPAAPAITPQSSIPASPAAPAITTGGPVAPTLNTPIPPDPASDPIVAEPAVVTDAAGPAKSGGNAP